MSDSKGEIVEYRLDKELQVSGNKYRIIHSQSWLEFDR